MDALIDQVEHELVEVQPDREATFADVVREWREWAEHTKRLKPAMLRNYDALLAPPGERPPPRRAAPGADHARVRRPPHRRGHPGRGRALPAPPRSRGLPGRSVNSHRQALATSSSTRRGLTASRCQTTRCAEPTSVARTTTVFESGTDAYWLVLNSCWPTTARSLSLPSASLRGAAVSTSSVCAPSSVNRTWQSSSIGPVSGWIKIL